MGNSPPGVRLLKTSLDFGKEQEALHRILDGRIRGEAADRANHLLFRGHALRVTGFRAAFKYEPVLQAAVSLISLNGRPDDESHDEQSEHDEHRLAS